MSLISRIVAALKSIGRDLKAGIASVPSFLDWVDQVIRYPFSLLGSGSPPTPSFTPSATKSDIIEDAVLARASAAVSAFDPTGIDTVRKFAGASKNVRDTTDLSALPTDARALLLTMDSNELAALSKAGPGEIRKFIVGKNHGVHGVPVVGVHTAHPLNDVRPSTREPLDHRLWKARAKLLKAEQSGEFRLSM